jgi:hypothetical protein
MRTILSCEGNLGGSVVWNIRQNPAAKWLGSHCSISIPSPQGGRSAIPPNIHGAGINSTACAVGVLHRMALKKDSFLLSALAEEVTEAEAVKAARARD